MKVLFVWSGVTSYMADCWRVFSKMPDVELKVLIADREGGYGTAFDEMKVMRDLNWSRGTHLAALSDCDLFHPDIIFVVGWRETLCRQVALSEKWASVPKVLCFDMPWEWKLRKILARFVLRRYLKHFRAALVPGRVSARYAKWLGFKKIFQGMFGINVRAIQQLPTAGNNRMGFLFVGRLSPEKRIDVLVEAYRLYRAKGGVWDLDVYGVGSESSRLQNQLGIIHRGFAQPDAVRAAYRAAGALVLTSTWDPWPLVIAESCAANLPVICTNHCWNACELIHENGRVVPVGDVPALADAMLRMEQQGPACAQAAHQWVEPYSCEAWSERVHKICKELI